MANFSKSNVPQFSVDVYQNEYLPEGGREVNAVVTVTATGGGTIGSAVAAPHLYSPQSLIHISDPTILLHISVAGEGV
ncbi:hypothetical protein [Streptomyces albogriseolus]|uniref:hypothetical protein n=1 Tax=Streptomyces albogriseolus TaxID=1887 RepID=UPI00367C408E